MGKYTFFYNRFDCGRKEMVAVYLFTYVMGPSVSLPRLTVHGGNAGGISAAAGMSPYHHSTDN